MSGKCNSARTSTFLYSPSTPQFTTHLKSKETIAYVY
jgi:hypothetical protein